MQRDKGETKGDQVAIGEAEPRGQVEKRAQIGTAGVEIQREWPVDQRDRDPYHRHRRGGGEHDASRPSAKRSASKRPGCGRAGSDRPINVAKRRRGEAISVDNPPVEQCGGPIDEQSSEDHIGQKVSPLDDPTKPNDSPDAQSGDGCRAPVTSPRQQESKSDERKAERGVAGNKGTVAWAFRRWQRSSSKLVGATEGLDLRRARSTPMVLEKGVGEQSRTQSDGRDKKDERVVIEPPKRSAGEEEPDPRQRGDGEDSPGYPRNSSVKIDDRRPSPPNKAASRNVEPAARDEVDLRHQSKENQHQSEQPGVDRCRFHAGAGCSILLRTSALTAAPARAVSSGIGYDQDSISPVNGRVMPAARITA